MLKNTNPTISRRLKSAFLGMALMAGLSFSAPTLPPAHAAAFGNTEALLLSCIDYRLVNETEAYMAGRGLRDKYDHIILAGASLGAHNDKFPAWGQTFFDHVDVAIKLHNIHKVIIMDHRDCGAYKVFLGLDNLTKEREKETKVHLEHMEYLAGVIQKQHPDLEVEMLLIDLDGKVEKLSEKKGNAAAPHH
jgi:carbonic anhydrase